MELTNGNLEHGSQHKDVQEQLHPELLALGFDIDPAELDEGFFGDTTHRAVMGFQRDQGLAVTGTVDEETAASVNAAVEARQAIFIVGGQVRWQDGAPAVGLVVRAVDRDLRSEQLLGETTTSTQGRYKIAYSADQFARAEKKAADLLVRVFDEEGRILVTSDTYFNADPNATVNLVAVPPEQPSLSEYERLRALLAPILVGKVTSEADLLDEDIDFLVGEFNGDRAAIEILVQAARLGRDTGLPVEAFYGWGRLGFDLTPESLLEQKAAVLGGALETAIKECLIPDSLGENIGAILDGLERLRLDSGLEQAFDFFGRLLDEQSGQPLAGYTVRAFYLDLGSEPVLAGHDLSNASGYFVISYNARREQPVDEETEERFVERRVALQILDEQGEEIHKPVVTTRPGLETVTDIPVPVPAADPSPTLKEVVELTQAQLPAGLLDRLVEAGIDTLADIRAAGGIRDLDGLPVPPDDPAVSMLEAQANLNVLSDDVAFNARLITSGLTSLTGVAQEPRASFVRRFHGDIGDVKAAKLHAEAKAKKAFLDNLSAGFSADRANGYPAPGGADGVFEIFPRKCSCPACESAVSPLAYLADLLDYATTHLRDTSGGQDQALTLDDLSRRFGQPFGDLPTTCQVVEEKIRQVGICIEVLRTLQGARPLADAAREAALARAESHYVFAAYQALLSAIGTSYEELRQARTAEAAEQERLANRLGITVDHLEDLLLDPGATAEQDLADLFGLPVTDGSVAAAPPAFLTWRLGFLRALWLNQDRPTPVPDDAYPIIDPDLIGPADLATMEAGDLALGLWLARRQHVDDLLAAIRSEREADGLGAVVTSQIGRSLSNLDNLRTQLEEGEDIEPQLSVLRLTLPAFLRLLALADLVGDGQTLLDSELQEIDSILAQVQKQTLFPGWIQEEDQAGLALGPDHFRLVPEAPAQLPPWRATADLRRRWENRLQARIDQEQAAVADLRQAVEQAEEATLPGLRDALVLASDAVGDNLEEKASWITSHRLIDAQVDGCQLTTRVAQAIETIQGLLWSIRSGVLQDSQPGIILDADNFYEEWQWLGSYETWRAAMFVFLYPENMLLPMLRNQQTPGFRRLIQEVRNQNRLTAEGACDAAREYADYFGDVSSLTVAASCQADSRIYHGESCRERAAVEYRYLAYHFGWGELTSTVYWSTVDLRDRCGDSQSFWQPVPGLGEVEDIIGAVPYQISEDRRLICLFVRTRQEGEQKLKLTRYDLEEGRWDDEPTELDLPPDGQIRFTAVTGQRDTEIGPPHLAIRGRSGAIYDRRLNREATGWGDDDSTDQSENDGDWHVLIGRSKGREFKRLWSMVKMDETSFFLLVQDRQDQILYRLFGPKDDGHWFPTPYRKAGDDIDEGVLAKEWRGEPVGAFLWPRNQLYVFWKRKFRQVVEGATFFAPDLATGGVESFGGEGIATYYQRIVAREPSQSLRITSFAAFDRWLRRVTGVSLTGLSINLDGSDRTVLDFFTQPTDDMPALEVEFIYKKDVARTINAMEGKIRDDEAWKEWRYADVLVRRLSSEVSLPEALRTLFANRFVDDPQAIHFRERDDGLSPVRAFSGGLDHIAPQAAAPPRAGVIDQRLATQYRDGQVGAYQANLAQRSGGELREIGRRRLVPRCSGPMEIVEQLTEEERGLRRKLIRRAFLDNEDGPPSHLTYLKEAYYFVPVHLALQLQRRGQYLAALDWFRTVYDYGGPEDRRKIYYGLVLEESLDGVYRRAQNWLGDPLNPHTIAEIRANSYTRFTILSLVSCLLEFADAEFTRDTAESVAQARSLYLAALDLLDRAVIKQLLNPCSGIIEGLNGELAATITFEAPAWAPVWTEIVATLEQIESRAALRSAVDEIQGIMSATEPLVERLVAARETAASALSAAPPRPTMAQALTRKRTGTARTHAALLGSLPVYGGVQRVGACAGNDWQVAVEATLGMTAADLDQDPALPWLRQPLASTAGTLMTSLPLTGAQPGGGNSRFNPIAPSRLALVAEAFSTSPLEATRLAGKVNWPFIPSIWSDFCVPPNPIISSLRFRAELNLYKIRTCRNIAGDERELEPYAAPVDASSGLPLIGLGGQLSLPASLVFRPTPYRYTVLIERAKQLVGLAQQIEAAFLSALEKRDAEYYQLLRARQELRLAQAGVRLQELRVKEAEGGVTLAQLQRDRARIQENHYNSLLNEGLLALERDALIAMTASLIVPDSVSFGFGTLGPSSTTSYSPSGKLQTLANIASTMASYERREQEWTFQRDLARQDKRIGDQQITLARDRVRIVGQERVISEIQADQAGVTAEFLASKFTNAELYEWMSQVLEGVYSFFLQQATAVARLAENQLAFERQQLLPPAIQADYWEAPLGLEIGGFSSEARPDRRGLTGSTRLLQDVYQLDQYAFETDQRKLQLSKTLSLANLAPAEFQRFRETGVLRFATPLALFDHDFPGHYLRLIKRVNTSIIALIPPAEGIKATLATTGVSRVTIDSGGAFQVTEVTRPPESVALSSPVNATGVFELSPQNQEMLLPFEGLGVATAWELQLPKAANQFDFNTIADVLVTIGYTALHSFDYRRQVVQQLNRTFSADRPFSFRQEFADEWYDLNHPELIEAPGLPMVVEFETRRGDFPPNLKQLAIQHVVLYFARRDGSAFELTADLSFTPEGGTVVGGSATSIQGIISTRRGNAPAGWADFIGKQPLGRWRLRLPDTDEVKNRFKEEDIEDILFVISYSGETPEWPV